MHEVLKSYGHERGLTTTFRNWRDNGHCNTLHGYALRFDFRFRGPLDRRGWVVDFGGLAPLHDWLKNNHDHVTYVAEDDPKRPLMEMAAREGLFNLKVLPAVGMEAFAQRAYERAVGVMLDYNDYNSVQFANLTDDAIGDPSWKATVHSCTVYEHPSNAVTYYGA